MWDALDIGPTPIQVLEPGCGTGNFMAGIPDDVAAHVSGVELDPISARIAAALNPYATILNADLADCTIQQGSFDLAIGNVPYSGDISLDYRTTDGGTSRLPPARLLHRTLGGRAAPRRRRDAADQQVHARQTLRDHARRPREESRAHRRGASAVLDVRPPGRHRGRHRRACAAQTRTDARPHARRGMDPLHTDRRARLPGRDRQRQPGGRQRHAHARGGRHQTSDRPVRRRLRRRLPGRRGTDRRTAPDDALHADRPRQAAVAAGRDGTGRTRGGHRPPGPCDPVRILGRPSRRGLVRRRRHRHRGRPRSGRRGAPTARHDPPARPGARTPTPRTRPRPRGRPRRGGQTQGTRPGIRPVHRRVRTPERPRQPPRLRQ